MKSGQARIKGRVTLFPAGDKKAEFQRGVNYALLLKGIDASVGWSMRATGAVGRIGRVVSERVVVVIVAVVVVIVVAMVVVAAIRILAGKEWRGERRKDKGKRAQRKTDLDLAYSALSCLVMLLLLSFC